MTHTKLYALLIVGLFAMLPVALADTHAETGMELEAEAQVTASPDETTSELSRKLQEIRAEKDASGALYGLRTAMDRLRISLEREEAKRAERALEQAEKRLAELERAAQEGDERATARAEKAHERQIAQAERAILRLEGNGDEQASRERMQQASQIRVRTQTQLEHVSRVHERILERQGDRMSEEQLARLEEVFAQITTRLERVDAQTEERRVNARTQTRAVGSLSEEETTELEAEIDARTQLSIILEERERALIERLEKRNERMQEAVDARAERAREQLNERLERQLERIQENLEARRERMEDRFDDVGTVIGVGGAQARLEATAAQNLRVANQELERGQALYERASNAGFDVPRARSLLNEAQTSLEQSKEQFDNKAFERSRVLSQDAREDIRLAQRLILAQTSDDDRDDDAEDAREEIAEAREEIRRAEATIDRAEQQGRDVSNAQVRLDRARELLAQAQEAYELELYERAEELADQAEDIADDILDDDSDDMNR